MMRYGPYLYCRRYEASGHLRVCLVRGILYILTYNLEMCGDAEI